MSKINLRKEPDGWRAYIKSSRGTMVVDGFFEDEFEAADAALALTSIKPYNLR